ncbi:MAG: glycosyltransferase [Nanobdellota archaeon]
MVTQKERHEDFRKSGRKHILLITNHGCHSREIHVTTDTGGQNFYVNDFAKALLKLGYKVTILNRGGYRHPVTGKMHKGVFYYDETFGKMGEYCRLLYLEDSIKSFVPKEKLKLKHLSEEVDFFFDKAHKLGMKLEDIFFISSHYWDGGIVGTLINRRLGRKVPHLWTPHSLGKLKRYNYRNKPKWIIRRLNFPTRIRNEEKVLSEVDGVVSTSGKITNTLEKYNNKPPRYWFPPGIDMKVFRPRKNCNKAVKLINEFAGRQIYDKGKKVFLEVSRTARPKQKDVVMKAFSKVKDNAILAMTIDKETNTYDEIMELKKELDSDNIILLDRFLEQDEIAQLFSLADVYVTASVMEGWGMSVQQAAASRCAIISSKYVPFVNEVLKEKAFVVDNKVSSYASQIQELADNPEKAAEKAEEIYEIAKGYSWEALSRRLIKEMRRCLF